VICDLSDWGELDIVRPSDELAYRPNENPHCVDDSSCPQKRTIQAAVDPVLGRIALAAGVDADAVFVDYAYGFGANLGGGPYERAVTTLDGGAILLRVAKSGGPGTYNSLAAALGDVNASDAVIRIEDNGIYGGDLDVALSTSQSITIEAANGVRPCILAPIPDSTPPARKWPIGGPESSQLRLSGLLIDGQLELTGNLNLTIEDCTLAPRRKIDPNTMKATGAVESSIVGADPDEPSVEIAYSITGPIQIPTEGGPLVLRDSIVDGFRGDAITGADAVLERTTVFGRTSVRSIEASECIFDQSVVATRTQVGCVRFSHVGESEQDGDPLSKTPRRYRCQPDLALEREAHRQGKDSPSELDDDVRDLVKARVAPIFTSREYGEAAYAQLAGICPTEIKAGAGDGGEMGAFCRLQQPHRESNLNTALQEYLPFGLEIALDRIT